MLTTWEKNDFLLPDCVSQNPFSTNRELVSDPVPNLEPLRTFWSGKISISRGLKFMPVPNQEPLISEANNIRTE